MITTIRFDVHGQTAASVREEALIRLRAFDSDFDHESWTIEIDVFEESTAIIGEVALWRGEVEARHHGPPF
jgi:hypothetical protein